jgi:hypothetical protein
MSIELSPRKRGKLVELVMSGTSHRKAAAALGVSKSTVWQTMLRERTHNTQNSLPRSGRPPLIDIRSKRRLVSEICAHPEKPWKYFAHQFGCSEDVIQRAANQVGFYKRHKRKKPFLSKKAIAARNSWVTANKDQDWKRVVFTDEASTELGLDITQQWTIRRAGEKFLPQYLQTTFRLSHKTMMI